MILKGIFPIVPTPFLDDGRVDYTSIERLIDFMAQKQVHGLAVMGALGEGHKLNEQERAQIIAHYRERLPRDMLLVVFRIRETDANYSPARLLTRRDSV